MSRNFSDEFENEKEGGPADETFEEMLRRLAASGNLHIRHVDGDGPRHGRPLQLGLPG